MLAILRVILATVLTLAAIVATVLLVAWPWPAPEVDWRTPLAAALAKNDCDRVGDIINAATEAGSLEAYDLRAKPDALGPCRDSAPLSLPPDLIAANGARLRKARSEPRSLSRHADDLAALSFWMRQYAQTVDFFCLQPYDTDIKIDYAALSAVVPDEAGWLSAVHRQRRTLCIGLVNDLAATLAANSERQAKELAHSITTWPPAIGSAGASMVKADLVLRQDFISRSATRNDPELLSTTRRTAWWLLDTAAASGDPAAIDLMIALLREGRFLQDATSLFERAEPYFWVLRGRRFVLAASPAHTEVERALSAEERRRITAEEESDWLRSRTSPRERGS